MKASKYKVVVGAVMLLILSISVWAKRSQWKPAKRPPVSLTLAVELCKADLRDRFGEQASKFYCGRATLASTFTKADWELHFWKEGDAAERAYFSVGSDRSVKFSERGFDY